MSSLNVELVHIILTTVSKETVGVPKSQDPSIYQSYDFKGKHEFTIEHIEIEDAKKWDSSTDMQKEGKADLFGLNEKLIPKAKSYFGWKEQLNSGDRLIINEDIRVTEWAPDVFAFLRQHDGISDSQLSKSLDPDNNRENIFKAGESQGKSGSFFFFSTDRQFIIKTMTDSDFNAFMRIIKSYFQRVTSQPKSLLARIYGIYTVKMEDQNPVQLVVMGNTMGKNCSPIEGIFDLKGSMVNR